MMKNVICSLDGTKLVIVVDLTEQGEVSKGNDANLVIASSMFEAIEIDGEPLLRNDEKDALKLSLTLLEEPAGTQAARDAERAKKGKGKAVSAQIAALEKRLADRDAKIDKLIALATAQNKPSVPTKNGHAPQLPNPMIPTRSVG